MGPRGYDEAAKNLEDDEGGMKGGSEVKGETGKTPESASRGGVGFCFCEVDFVGCRILYFDFPLVDVAVGAGAGIGTGVAVLDVSVEPDKEDGTLIEDMESGSNDFLALPFN